MLNTTLETGKVNSKVPGAHDFTRAPSQTFKEHLILMLNNLFQSTKSDGKKPQALKRNKHRTKGKKNHPTEREGKRIIGRDLAGLRNIRTN